MTQTPAREHYLAEFRRLESAMPGAALPWLTGRRKHALEQFAQSGFPTTRDEDWKYTNVGPLERKVFSLGAGTGTLDAAGIAPYILSEEFPRLVFVNGRLQQQLCSNRSLPTGVTLTSISGALNTHAGLLESCTQSEGKARSFVALNEALFLDGAFLTVAANVSVEQPVHLLFLGTDADHMSHVLNIIHAGEGAKLTVIEHYVGVTEASYFTNAVTHALPERNATIEHHKLQQESLKAFHIAAILAKQAVGSSYRSYSYSLGAALARNDIHTRFEGEGAESLMNGLYMVDGRQHVDHHTRVDHAVPRCTSREFYKGVLDGASRAVFNGKVIVHRDAQHTDAQQTNKNLLLSGNAEVDTKPELEIYADDVKCAHGATVGQLDAAQLFYLRSRGIDEVAARALLTYAFAEDIVGAVPVMELRTRLEEILIGRVPQSERLKEIL